MLISALSFEIFDSHSQIAEEFLIENTFENQEKVFAHSHTRNLRFIKVFDFQFAKEERTPMDFINPLILMTVLINADSE